MNQAVQALWQKIQWEKKNKKKQNLKGNDSRAKLTFFSSENAFKIILYIPAI